MVCPVKICLYVQLLFTSALALPVSPETKHEKRSLPTSHPGNLLEKNYVENATPALDLKSTADKPQNDTTVPGDTTEKPYIPLSEPLTDFSNDEFKVKVLDLPNLPKEKNLKIPEVQIGLPAYGPETRIIKVPEPYIIRVPHYIVVKEPHFIVSGDHFGAASIPGSFHPFGEFPGITAAFPSSENIFDISQIYPSNPIEISQGFEGFPPINGVSEIQGFPGFGDISQGFEVLQPEPIQTVGITEEKFDHASDSVIIEALEGFRKDENVVKEETTLKEERSLKEDKISASHQKKIEPTTEHAK